MTIIAGIDPGISGAIAFYVAGQDGRIGIHDMPPLGKEVSAPHLADLFRQYRPSFAVVERVGAMPGNGGTSMFNFGRSCGVVHGVIGAANIPMHYVTPKVWKKYFGLSKDKSASRTLATQRFPAVWKQFELVKHDGRAEAALIALYGAEVIMKREAA